jgi:hypothetical protein
MDPVFVAATFCDRSDAGVGLQCRGVRKAVALLAERGEESGGENGPRTRESGKELEISESCAATSDLIVEAQDGGIESAKLRKKGLDDDHGGLDYGRIGSERGLGFDRRDPIFDDLRIGARCGRGRSRRGSLRVRAVRA